MQPLIISLFPLMTIYRKSFTAQGGIPIVPMLDILTILLIFFIVHTEFKRQVSVLQLTLPQTHHLAGERGDAQQILLEVSANGALALAGKEIQKEHLGDILTEMLKKSPDTRLQVAAADASSLGELIEVLDILTNAGIQAEQVPVRINYAPEQGQ